MRDTTAEEILHNRFSLGNTRTAQAALKQWQKQSQELMRILLNLIIQLKRLHKGLRVDETPDAATQLREKPRDLIQDRELIQNLEFNRENAFPESGVHVEALEYTVGVASSAKIG